MTMHEVLPSRSAPHQDSGCQRLIDASPSGSDQRPFQLTMSRRHLGNPRTRSGIAGVISDVQGHHDVRG
jgi:hypothetical protein